MSSVNYAAALKRAPPPTSSLTSASNKKKKKKKEKNDVMENNRNNNNNEERNAVNNDVDNANRNNKWLSTPGNARGPPVAILSKPRQQTSSTTTTNAWKKIPSTRNPSVNPRQQQQPQQQLRQDKPHGKQATTTTTTKTTKNNKQPAANKPAFSKKPKPSSSVVLGDVIMRQVLQQKSSSSSSSRQPKRQPLSLSTSLLSTTNPSKTKRKKVESNNANNNHKPAPKTPKAVNNNNNNTSSSTTGISLLQTFGAKQRTDEEANLFGKFATTTFSKGRQRLQPRKKKFSTLKKKILQERLDQWRALNPNPDSATRTQTDEPEASSSLGKRVVALPHFVHPEEDNLQDDDEYQELLDNLTELATKVGTVQTVVLSRNPAHEGVGLVCFDKPTDAAAAKACWEGLVLGGVRLQPELVLHDASLDRKEDNDNDDGGGGNHQETLLDAYIAQCQRHKEAAAAQALAPTVVILDNILTLDDFQDEDCLQESLHDIQAMAERIGQVLRVEETNQRVHLTYADGTGAQHAVQQFHQRVVGGQVVSARLQETTTTNESPMSLDDNEDKGSVSHAIVLYDLLTEDDLEDEDCLEESKADTTALASQFGSVVRIDVDLDARTVRVEYAEPLDVVEKATAQFNGMVFGGQRVRAVLDRPLQDGSSPELLPNPAVQSKPLPPLPDADQEEEKKQIMYSGDKVVSERFAECKRVPKVPNAGVPRKYATLTDDETVKPLLSAMLGELMRLQKRAVEDKNAKARRRLVMGLREVARGIRSHKVKLVVMANNLDQYGALDDKLQEILDLAATESVPVFFEFSKRSLGKAVGKTIKMAVIGVQNADGAHQQFKKLLQIAASH